MFGSVSKTLLILYSPPHCLAELKKKNCQVQYFPRAGKRFELARVSITNKTSYMQSRAMRNLHSCAPPPTTPQPAHRPVHPLL